MNIAKMIALVLGVFMILLGLTALTVPDRVLPLAQFTTTPNGVYVATIIRFAIGIILLFAASQSRFPKVLRASERWLWSPELRHWCSAVREHAHLPHRCPRTAV